MYNGAHVKALQVNGFVWIENFTGSYVVFATPNPAQGNLTYAINLLNGEMISGAHSNIPWEMSGESVGAYSNLISGIEGNFTAN